MNRLGINNLGRGFLESLWREPLASQGGERQFLPVRTSSRQAVSSRRGQALVEFAMSALIALSLILGVVEFSRIMLVYTTIADAARLGARYATTHGTIPGQAANESSIQSGVQAVVQKFLAPGTVNIANATITTSFPNVICGPSPTQACLTGPGNTVEVTVSYPYNLIIHRLPISVTISNTSEGIITW